MGFLSPAFLVGAFAASLPIVLHLLKRDPEVKVPFSAVHLLQHAPVETASRRRLRELLLLALRVAGLFLFAFAFARPYFGSDVGTNGSTLVVALDISLSMSAPGQFEKARQLAKQAVASSSGASLVGVVTFADGAQVASRPSADRAAAQAAIDAAKPGAGATRFRAGLNAAVDLLRGRPGRVVIVTDLQATGWDAGDRVSVPESVTVDVADVGAPPANLAVTAVRVSGTQVVATIRNAGAEAMPAAVHLNVPGTEGGATRVAADASAQLGGGQSVDLTFPLPNAPWASVSVDDGVGAAADNARYLVLDNTARPSVLVIGTTGDLPREAFYLEQALAASGADGRAYAADSASAGELASWDQARIDRHTAVVLLSTRALEHHGRELLTTYLKKGGGLIVAANADVDGDVLHEVLGGPALSLVPSGGTTTVARTWSPTDVRHPLIRAFGSERGALGPVRFDRIGVVRSADCPVLARFTTGEPALLDCASGDGHALVFASDLDNRGNDFPLHATFVPFLHESLKYLGAGRRSADVLVADVPPGVSPVPGVTSVTTAGVSRLVAVNADPSEADPGRLTMDEFKSAVATLVGGGQSSARLQAEEREERQHIWQYVLGVMLVILLVESWVASRTA